MHFKITNMCDCLKETIINICHENVFHEDGKINTNLFEL